jgi:CDP-diacylglycerol--glycerol-3-phosphate 3-phosphatidyltransferase
MEESNSSESAATVKPTFTDQMRGYTAPLIDPVVTFLAHYKISPDVLTVVGMLAHFFLAYLIAIGEFRWAGIAMIFLAPLDALDGALARKLGRKQGGFGAYLDSTLDRLAEVILFGGFIYYYFSINDPRMLAVAYVAITGSLMVSYSRAKAESLGYENKVGVASRVERYLLMIVLLILNLPNIALIILAITTYFTLGQRMYSVWKQEYGQKDNP